MNVMHCVLWSSCFALGGAGIASAQQVASTAATDATVGDELTEIVVTAQRRSENLQNVPIAVTALTDATRELLGIKTVQDITDFTPSLVYYNGVDRLTLRGIGRLTNNAGTEPGVATYIDGFYVTSNVLVGLSDLFNQRVEILSGPQGTLYGRNAIGGAIDTISRRPTDDWSGEVRVTAANFDRNVEEGTISGPIVDGWKFRVTANHTQQKDGWYNNIGSAASEGATAQDYFYDLQLQGAVGPVDIWAKYFRYQINETERILNTSLPYDTSTFFGPSNLIPSATFGYTVPNPQTNSPFTINTNTPGNYRFDRDDLWVGHVTWHTGPADLNYIGGYYRYNVTLQQDNDNTSRTSYACPATICPLQPTVSATQIFLYQEFHHYGSNELNLTSSGDGPLQWIVGLYEINDHLYEPFYLRDPGQQQLAQPVVTLTDFTGDFTLGGGAANPQLNYVTETGLLHTKSEAAYGQIDWKFIDQWKLTAGVRGSKDDKTGQAVQRFVYWNPAAAPAFGAVSFDVTPAVTGYPAGTTPAIMNVQQTTRGVSGTLGTEWQPVPDMLAYLKYSRGFKAGSLNLGQVSFSNPQSTTAMPEKLDAFELGLKRHFSTFQINGDIYYYNYKDAQIPTQVLGTGNVAVTQFTNIAAMHDYGLELETIWQPVDAFTALVNYSYLNTKITQSKCIIDAVDPFALAAGATPCPGGATATGVAQSPVGSHMLGSPPNKISASLSYRMRFTAGSVTITPTDSWRDKQYSYIFSRSYWQTPSYNLINLRAEWTGIASNYNIIAYGTNLANRIAVTDVGASATTNGIQRAFGFLSPRTYGLELQYRFGNK